MGTSWQYFDVAAHEHDALHNNAAAWPLSHFSNRALPPRNRLWLAMLVTAIPLSSHITRCETDLGLMQPQTPISMLPRIAGMMAVPFWIGCEYFLF